MDPQRFDAWTRSLHSRRTVVPMLVGLGVGLGVTRQAVAAPRPTKKSKRPTFGCTKQNSICTDPETLCPDAPAGFCANDNKGKPFCAIGGDCAPCTKNGDCAAFGPGALCVKKCPICQGPTGTTACFVPLTDR
jgi:hypothetical protein